MTASGPFEYLLARLREEQPHWGRLPAAMRFKQDLVKHYGVYEAHRLAAPALAVPGIDVLQHCAVGNLHDAAKASGSYRLLWDGGESFTAPPTRIVGRNDHGPFAGLSRAAYAASLESCAIRGRSALLRQGSNTVLQDFEGHERDGMSDNPEYDPGVMASAPDHYWMMGPSSATGLLEVDEAFLLSGSHTLDFGHWVMEYLPRIAMAKMAKLKPMPVLVDLQIPQSLIESLDIFWPERTATIALPHLAPAIVRKLWVAPCPMYMGFYPTEWSGRTWLAMATHGPLFAALIRELLRPLPPVPAGGRIYLARKPNQLKKRLLNYAEIEAIARQKGFDIVYPQDLTFAEQLRISRSAEVILGPEGSAMFWAFFSRPGTRACVLSPEHTFPLADINSVMTALGIDYTVFTGISASGDPDWPFWVDYTIDPAAFSAFLSDWLP